MEYSPIIEDDPILVFKKIYGDDAYKKAGSFPGAFEIGEDFKHYEKIFKENMGEDLLKVKDKKYVGDGKLVLTKQEEVFEPTPDDDVPFAKGGRASFVSGKSVMGVTEIIKMLTKKMSPMGAMKELNKIIGKKGQYSGLTKADIDKIVADTNDFIFQRDPDNLFVEGSLGKTANKVDEARAKDQKMAFEDSIKEMEGLGATQTAERFRLKQKYPGLDDDLLTNIIEDTDPMHKASVLAKIDQAMELTKRGKNVDETIQILESEPKTKMATGGRAGYYVGGQAMIEPDLSDIGHGSDALMARTRITAPGSQATTSTGLNYLLGEDNDNIRVPFRFGGMGPGKVLQDEKKLNQMLENFLIKEAPYGILTPRPKDLELRNLKTADRPPKPEIKIGPYDPQSGINPYSKDNVVEFDDGTFMYKDNGKYFKVDEEDEPYEVPGPSKGAKIKPIEMEAAEGGRAGFNQGLLVPEPKPYTPDMFEKDSMTLLQGMYGTGKDSNEFLYNEMIKKGNILRNQGVERETVIEIIRNNKDKINAFLETQTTSPKTLKGLADGGPARKGFKGGGSDASTTSFSESFDNQHGTNTASRANKSVDRQQAQGQAQADATNARMANTDRGREQTLNNYIAVNYPNQNPNNKTLGQKIGYGLESFFNNPYVRGYATIGTGGFSEKLRQMMMAKKAYDNRDIFQDEIIEDEIRNIPITGGITSNYADGGRIGYAGGKGVDIARRGFLKILGGSVAAATAFKMGLVKMLGKESGAVSKKAVDQFFASGTSGAPTWFEPLVNKALREGLDITEKAAVKDGQIVKSLDTPTGKVDVTYDTRTGAVDIDYMGGDTAMGEGLQMRYAPGEIIEEGANMGKKTDDVFEAVETVPEGKMYSPDDYQVEFGENMTSNIDDLYSDTSELATLGGEKLLVKDISNTLKKKKVLKEMDNNPDQFASDNLPDYDY